MTIPLSTLAAIKAAAQNQQPQLVLKIKGYDKLLSLGAVTEYIRVGDEGLLIGDDWTIGGLRASKDSLDLINLKGSSRTLNQQINPDRGGEMSVPTFAVNLIDIDAAMTKLISPGVELPDILGVQAELYLGFKNTAFPQDFIRIISGIIDKTEAGSGITLNVAHPEQKKKTDIFIKGTTELTSAARYRSKDIQGLTYITRREVVTSVTVTYTSGGVAGSEVVSVVGTNITVQIDAGVSTANQVRNAIEESIEALSLVTISVYAGPTTQSVQATTTLDTVNTIDVLDTSSFLTPAPTYGLRTYVRIDDEVIEYTGKTATSFTGCTRQALVAEDPRAEGAHHNNGTSVESFYRLQGNAFVMALRLLLSNGGEYISTDIDIKHIGAVEELTTPNALYFDGIDVITKYGVTIGDFVSITGDLINPSNNVTDAEVSDVVTTQYGSYIILGDETLIESLNTPAVAAFKSKYNVLPASVGLGLSGEEVDVPRFEELLTRYSSSIFEYDFYIKDTVAADEFINTRILFSTGAYPVPRLGKISVSKNVPPLGTADLLRLNEHNTQDPQSVKVSRSINRYFYNNVVFKFNEAVVDERYLSGDVNIDTESQNRIKIGARTQVIECGGIRPTVDNLEIIKVLKDQIKNKYRFGAEVVTVKAFYGDAFNRSVGDVIIFGEGLKLADTKTGSRNFVPRLWDVLNMALTPETGGVELTLMDSGYSLANARYGVISPSSLCGVGSTPDSLKIKNSFDIVAPRTEDQKWRQLAGIKLLVHNEDYSVMGETYLTGVSPSDRFTLNVEPPLGFSALEDYVIDIAPYPDNEDPEDDAIAKSIYVFTNPTVAITSGVDNFSFNVSLLDATLFKEGAVLMVHDDNDDWVEYSPEVKVLSVVGTLVTVDADLTFTAAAGYEVELIGYPDKGAPYRYF